MNETERQEVLLDIPQLNWPSWETLVAAALDGIAGVTDYEINGMRREVRVEMDPNQIDENQLVDAVKKRTRYRSVSIKPSWTSSKESEVEMRLRQEDRQFIHTEIQKKYAQVALGPKGQFAYPTGREGLEKLHYDRSILADLPDAVADSFCGVGNPFSLGDIPPGCRVLDIGCGVGVDALVAAHFVGDTGEILGIDLTPKMIEKANANKALMKADNVTFKVCDVKDLAQTEHGFDVILSNGVFNLVPEKEAALASAFRLLKPGGRIFIADQFATGSPPQDIRERVKTWFQWEGGAVPETEFLALLEKAGFTDAECVGETGFNSSPKTRGMLIKARRLEASELKSKEPSGGKKGKSREIESRSPQTQLTLDDMVHRAVEMGAETAKWIDTDSIVVEKWVKWKCIYGCPMYGKDGYHPPETPDIDEVRDVVGEYAKAIMLQGRDGTRLTEIACRLEGEAYHSGFYKAFALTALSAGSSTGAAPGGTWPTGKAADPCDSSSPAKNRLQVRPMMEACGIDVFKTARRNGFQVDTRKETFGGWNFFALVLIE